MLLETLANFFTILWFLLSIDKISHRYTCLPILNPPPTSLPTPSLWVLRALALSALLHALNLYCSSILHVVIYMFQCYSLKSSHPCLLPESKSLFFISESLLLPFI